MFALFLYSTCMVVVWLLYVCVCVVFSSVQLSSRILGFRLLSQYLAAQSYQHNCSRPCRGSGVRSPSCHPGGTVRNPNSSCEICGGRSMTRTAFTAFTPNTSGSPPPVSFHQCSVLILVLALLLSEG